MCSFAVYYLSPSFKHSSADRQVYFTDFVDRCRSIKYSAEMPLSRSVCMPCSIALRRITSDGDRDKHQLANRSVKQSHS